MTISRRQAREWAIQMLCAADLNPPENVDAFIAAYWEQLPTLENEEGGIEKTEAQLKPRDAKRLLEMKGLSEALVRGVFRDLNDIDAALRPLMDHWDLYRLGTVERAVLRMGIYEIKSGGTPVQVVINEAVDLVNWFSAPKSRMFVNGVLDKYAKSVKG